LLDFISLEACFYLLCEGAALDQQNGQQACPMVNFHNGYNGFGFLTVADSRLML
jgi:hypothetical protein